MRRNRFGWIWAATGLLCVVAAGGVLGGSSLIARGIAAIGWTRRELARLEARERALL